MSKDTSEIVVAANGSIHIMPTGTAAPADITASVDAAAVELGYTDDDGVTFSDGKDVEDINVWQLFYPARQIVTGKSTSISFNLVQWNKTTVPLAFGGGVVSADTPGSAFKYTPPAAGTIDERMLVVEWVDGSKNYRLVVPRIVVTDTVETQLTKASEGQLPLTCGVLGSDGVDPWYLQTDDPAFDPA